MLFVLGGNGTHAGANAIHNEVYHFSINLKLIKLGVVIIFFIV